MSDLSEGIDALRRGQWEAAHRIAQDDPSKNGSWLHGIVHIVEGDEDNARYWYAKAERTFPGMHAVEAELDALAAALDAKR